jgi:hypothetical protein
LQRLRKLSLTEVGDIYLRHCSASVKTIACSMPWRSYGIRIRPANVTAISDTGPKARAGLFSYLAMFPRVRLDLGTIGWWIWWRRALTSRCTFE